MNKKIFAYVLCAAFALNGGAQSLRQAYRNYWRTSVSVNQWQVKAQAGKGNGNSYSGNIKDDQTSDWPTIVEQFDYVVPENVMKCEVIHPQEGVYDFTLADQFVDKARESGLHVLGHCLIWHSQCAPWFHTDENGKLVSKEVLKKRMKEHITTIVSHFKGRVEGWDVVNEAFEDDGTLRKSLFYQILGEDFIPLAFQYAHEADPNVELYYNDYSMSKPEKIDGVINFFRPLIAKGLPITAIGMQGHLVLSDGLGQIDNYEKSIQKIAALGLPTFFSELDLSPLPNPYAHSGANISDNFALTPESNPYTNGFPAEMQEKCDDFWVAFYKMLLRNKEHVQRVGFWCFNDLSSWRNDWPIKGRTDYATLFDRNSKAKPTIQKLVDLMQPVPSMMIIPQKKKK